MTIIGSLKADPGYIRRLRRSIRRNFLSDVITITGRVDDSRLYEMFTNHDILCVPSEFEGFGIVYLEAMYFGLPAIGTTAGGARDIIRDAENGFLVRPGDVRGLKNRIMELAEDRELLEKMSRNALETAMSAPTWKDSMEKILKFLNTLVA